MENQIYVIECEGGKRYVGKSNNAVERFEQHKSGRGSEWTKKYKPLKLIEIRQMTSEHDENNITKDLMKKYGINNVRGGSYCQVSLPDASKKALELELLGNSDACFKCGKSGHFARNCPNEEEEDIIWECNYCNKEFDVELTAKRHEQKCKFVTMSRNLGKQKLVSRNSGPVCYRCDRPGHYSTECYARTNANGDYL